MCRQLEQQELQRSTAQQTGEQKLAISCPWPAPTPSPPSPVTSTPPSLPPLKTNPQPVTLHTTPLFMGSLRLLPGGLALVAWAAAKGRPQPATATAWAWIAAFALVDGAMFQVRECMLKVLR
jgi:hypothetical protein